MRRAILSAVGRPVVRLFLGRGAHPARGVRPGRPGRASVGRLFVTNESGGDISVVDVGRRRWSPPSRWESAARHPGQPGRHALLSPLSGSPMAPPGVDETTLPPPTRRRTGSASSAVKDLKLLKVLQAGSDPEQTAVTSDGQRLFVANEDTGSAPRLRSRTVTRSPRSRWAASRGRGDAARRRRRVRDVEEDRQVSVIDVPS
jgi:DNA-binding beta-propeller fold protein YncE